jgi:hypothetical protein
LQHKYIDNHKITLSSSFPPSFFLPPKLQLKACTNTKKIQTGKGCTLERRRWGVAARVVWWAAARTWGEGGCKNLGKEEMEGGGGQMGQERGGAANKRGRGRSARVGGEIVGSHPTDQDLWPKPALTSAPDPSVKVKKSSTASLRLCLLKLQAPIAQNTEEKKKKNEL